MREIFRAKDKYSEAEKMQFMKDHAETRYGRPLSSNWMKDGKPMEGKFDFSLWHALVVRPSTLYFHAVRSLCPFALRGVIWYQGETNVSDREYTEKQQALIESWRRMWGLGDYPFYTVQIAPLRWYTTLTDCWIRQYQTVRRVGNTGIVPTVDVGDLDAAHPVNKRDVGRRLAARALHDTYGQKDVVASGPVYLSQEVNGSKMVVRFAQLHGGLKTRDGKAPDWFEIAGADGKFVKADAKIAGDAVEVSAPDVSAPQFVRCGWHQTAEPNLANIAGWPVWPFNTALPFFSEKRDSYETP
jgi:sialate O-acetylesterase